MLRLLLVFLVTVLALPVLAQGQSSCPLDAPIDCGYGCCPFDFPVCGDGFCGREQPQPTPQAPPRGRVADCGGDTCALADACYTNAECNSGCCAGGYCAPPCVCQGAAGVRDCTVGDAEKCKSATINCSAAPVVGLWPLAGTLGLLLRRRRLLC